MNWIFEIINIKYILIYFLLINLTGFFAMAIDKIKAQNGYWRIPEGTLIMIAILGGAIGDLIGMYTFRHKTKKMKFTIGIPTIMILQIIIVIMTVFDLWKLLI